MPKAFTEQERIMIRAKLHDTGRELMAKYGIRKTSVEDVTKAAGISKGAFYLFYSCKEELFLEILGDLEVAAGLFRAIAVLILHKNEVGQRIFQPVFDMFMQSALTI